MKKRHYILLAIVAVGLLVCAAVALRPRQLPPEECSQLYRDYADNPHVTVAFIKDFPVNDTLRVDVTTLQATDSTGWHSLMLYFGYTEEMIDNYYESVKRMMDRPIHQIVRFTVDKNDYSKKLPLKDVNSRQVIGSYKDQTFSIYHTDNNEIKNIIAKTELKKLNPKKQ